MRRSRNDAPEQEVEKGISQITAIGTSSQTTSRVPCWSIGCRTNPTFFTRYWSSPAQYQLPREVAALSFRNGNSSRWEMDYGSIRPVCIALVSRNQILDPGIAVESTPSVPSAPATAKPSAGALIVTEWVCNSSSPAPQLRGQGCTSNQ
jgi:hypothetical protein